MGGTQRCIEAILNCADLEAVPWTSNKDSLSILTSSIGFHQRKSLAAVGRHAGVVQRLALWAVHGFESGRHEIPVDVQGAWGYRRMTRRRSRTAAAIRVSKWDRWCKSPLTIGWRRRGALSVYPDASPVGSELPSQSRAYVGTGWPQAGSP